METLFQIVLLLIHLLDEPAQHLGQAASVGELLAGIGHNDRARHRQRYRCLHGYWIGGWAGLRLLVRAQAFQLRDQGRDLLPGQREFRHRLMGRGQPGAQPFGGSATILEYRLERWIPFRAGLVRRDGMAGPTPLPGQPPPFGGIRGSRHAGKMQDTEKRPQTPPSGARAGMKPTPLRKRAEPLSFS